MQDSGSKILNFSDQSTENNKSAVTFSIICSIFGYLSRVATGEEKVRKMWNFFRSGKSQEKATLVKITKSQEKTPKFSFNIQWCLQFYRHLFAKIFQPCCARNNFHFQFCSNFNLFRNDVFRNYFCSTIKEIFLPTMILFCKAIKFAKEEVIWEKNVSKSAIGQENFPKMVRKKRPKNGKESGKNESYLMWQPCKGRIYKNQVQLYFQF